MSLKTAPCLRNSRMSEGCIGRTSQEWASLVAQLVKNPPAMWETWIGKIP